MSQHRIIYTRVPANEIKPGMQLIPYPNVPVLKSWVPPNQRPTITVAELVNDSGTALLLDIDGNKHTVDHYYLIASPVTV